jgi:hypothetical protein
MARVWARAGCWLAGEQEAVLGGQARGQQRFGAVVEQQCARPEQLAFLSSIFFPKRFLCSNCR